MPPGLKELLERAVERAGAGEQILAARVIETANKTLERIIGQDASHYAIARAYRRGTIIIETKSPVAAASLRQHEYRLLNELRSAFPRARFDRVQFQTPR